MKMLLPHITTYRHRWVRRTMLFVHIPYELWLAIAGVFKGAAFWWRQPEDCTHLGPPELRKKPEDQHAA
jgi:hypothetical protein